MATYPLKEVKKRWEYELLTIEQTIGHILQHLEDHQKRLEALERPNDKPPPPQPTRKRR